MTERYLWAHSVMHHHNELKVTKQGIGIPMIKSRASNVPIDKGNCIRGYLNPRHRCSSDEIIEEYVGANMGIQIPLLVIDRKGVSVMSAWFPNP